LFDYLTHATSRYKETAMAFRFTMDHSRSSAYSISDMQFVRGMHE
jgi:hypothetical protein